MIYGVNPEPPLLYVEDGMSFEWAELMFGCVFAAFGILLALLGPIFQSWNMDIDAFGEGTIRSCANFEGNEPVKGPPAFSVMPGGDVTLAAI